MLLIQYWWLETRTPPLSEQQLVGCKNRCSVQNVKCLSIRCIRAHSNWSHLWLPMPLIPSFLQRMPHSPVIATTHGHWLDKCVHIWGGSYLYFTTPFLPPLLQRWRSESEVADWEGVHSYRSDLPCGSRCHKRFEFECTCRHGSGNSRALNMIINRICPSSSHKASP
jgi:hypothetical protein